MRTSCLSVGGPSAPRGTDLAGSSFLAFTFDFSSGSSPSEGGLTCRAGRTSGDTEPVCGCLGGVPGTCSSTFFENETRGRGPGDEGCPCLCGDLGGGFPAHRGKGPPNVSTCAIASGVCTVWSLTTVGAFSGYAARAPFSGEAALAPAWGRQTGVPKTSNAGSFHDHCLVS